MGISLVELWHEMNWIARGVWIVLLIMSIISVAVALAKYIRFQRAKRASQRFVDAFTKFLEKQDLKGALNLTRDKKYRASHIAKIANAGLQEFLRITETMQQVQSNPTGAAVETFAPHKVLERTQHAMERAAVLLLHEFKSGLNSLATIGATAPFVGLFGTVMGIINSFQAMKTAGAGAIGEVSAGIAEALIATAIGLFVAIPAVWLYNYFSGRVERVQNEMENVTADLLDYLVDVEELMYAKQKV